MHYKVLITTSGIGQRLGDLTNYTNKALVRVGKKPIISHIIESYPKNVPLVITTGHFSNHIREYIGLVYPERNIQFVHVKNYTGPGSSLGYSMLQAQKYLNCSFIFHAADTIVEDKIPPPSKNWIGGYRGRDTSQYASWKVFDSNQYVFNPKGAIDFDYIHIGLIGINDHKSFWRHLRNLHKKNKNDSSLNDCHPIVNMLRDKDLFSIIDFKKWYDVGNTNSLEETRKHINYRFDNLHKADESIFILKDRVVKFFHDATIAEDRVKRQKLLKTLVPQFLAHQTNFYTYKYTPGELYSRIVTPKDFKRFLDWSIQKLWVPKKAISDKKFQAICRDFYYNKTQKRVEQFLTTNNLADEPHTINDEEVPSIKEMLSQIDFDELSKAEQYQFHGDFILDNILKTKNGYCLLDWRQHFGGLHEAGDMYYDLAKLNHNLTINHDIVHQNLITIKSENDQVRCDIHRTDNLVQCQKVLMDFIDEAGYNRKKVEILTGLIWLNMSPLHHYPFNLFLYYFGKLNLWRVIKKYR